MTRKIIIIGLFFFLAGFSAKAQLYSFGIKGGLGISHYNLSNAYVFYNTQGSSLSFHAGLFGRRYIGKFFIQGEALIASGMKAKLTFRNSEYSFSKSSISVPIILGRSFYPGNIRIYAGLSPSLYLGDEEIENYLTNNRLLIKGKSGNSQSIAYIGGLGIDFDKFTIDIHYEKSFFGGFFFEEKNANITTFHRFSHFLVSLGYKFQ